MRYDLLATVLRLDQIDCREMGSLVLPDGFCTPGFWAAIAAIANYRRYSAEDVIFGNDIQHSYSSTLGLHYALTGDGSREPNRPNEGRTYCPLVKLDCVESTDTATSTINSCLRAFSPESIGCGGFTQLCDVVGELHSNVWDHGESTGFSIAQRTKVPNEEDFFFEFALADCGCGFLREMTRRGFQVASDLEAIKWCIQEGNTTKSTNNRDEFAQRVPPDYAGGSPFGPRVEMFSSNGGENHHQGLGLYKLVTLVTGFKGELTLASGYGLLTINQNGIHRTRTLKTHWPGVAIACRLRESCLRIEESEESTTDIGVIIDFLGGGG